MPTTIDLEALCNGRWLIENGQIVCSAGEHTRIGVFGGTGELCLWALELPDEILDWLSSRKWITEIRTHCRGSIAFSFVPDRLGEVAKMLGARQVQRRAAG